MSVYFLSCDLSEESLSDQTGETIRQVLSALDHVHFQKHAWLVAIEDPKSVLQGIMECTKETDSFFITRVAEMGNVGGRIPQEVQDWLFAHLPA